jgi:hypothetical protein
VEITKEKWGARIHCEEEKIQLEKQRSLRKVNILLQRCGLLERKRPRRQELCSKKETFFSKARNLVDK